MNHREHFGPTAEEIFGPELPREKPNGSTVTPESERVQAVRPQWPESLAEEAFYGLAGEYVRMVGPHCEGDPAALLVQFLIAFGNRVGRSPHYMVGATSHHMNLNACLVGMTAKARKGTSWHHIQQTFLDLELGQTRYGFVSGLSSGEGLISAVRDAEPDLDDGKGGTKKGLTGVEDKRLMVTQGEFCSVLKVMDREGNILSGIIRDAFDDGYLSVMTKKRMTATGAHISIIGHITRDELRRSLCETDRANGFANRFLWVCVKRSKLLPEGGTPPRQEMRALEEKLVAVFSKARGAGIMKRDAEAKELWATVYEKLSESGLGLVDAVTARAEALTLRLSCIYALLDGSDVVRVEHLKAALAVWTYCEASCHYIFGESQGDPVADSILANLKEQPEGMARTEISNLFGRHRSKAQIDIALTSLLERGKVGRRAEATGGRPIEIWVAVSGAKEAN
jgi:hypothetical protein